MSASTANTNSASTLDRVSVYSMASAIDMVAASCLFAAPIRAARMGASYTIAGALGFAWALSCAATNFIIGRFVTPERAAIMCIVGCLVRASAHIGLIFSNSITAMFIFLAICGASHAIFMAPYQVFLKTVDSGVGKPLRISVALYTFAWSMGMAIGPLWTGMLLNNQADGGGDGWKWCFVFNAVASVLVAANVFRLRRYARITTDEPEPGINKINEENTNNLPDFAWLAWIAAFFGHLGFSLIRSLFPAGAVKIGIAESTQGEIIFVLGLTQALGALVLIKFGQWMFKPPVLLLSGIAGIMSMLFFSLPTFYSFEIKSAINMFFLGALFFGFFSSAFFSYVVYHSLAHPVRAGFNISMSEGFFSISGMVGPYIGGMLADKYGLFFPYAVTAGMFVVFVSFQIVCHLRKPLPLEFKTC